MVPQHGSMDFIIKFLTPGTVVHFVKRTMNGGSYFLAKISLTVDYPVYIDNFQTKISVDRAEFEGEIIEVRRHPSYIGLIVKKL